MVDRRDRSLPPQGNKISNRSGSVFGTLAAGAASFDESFWTGEMIDQALGNHRSDLHWDCVSD